MKLQRKATLLYQAFSTVLKRLLNPWFLPLCPRPVFSLNFYLQNRDKPEAPVNMAPRDAEMHTESARPQVHTEGEMVAHLERKKKAIF